MGPDSSGQSTMASEHLIKKYANRRMYDTALSRHVTVDDIRDIIVGGARVRVVEDKSGEDITRMVLLQVIAEQEQFGRPILSIELMESIIRFYGNPMQDLLGRFLEQSMSAFAHQQQAMGKKFATLVQDSSISTIAEITKKNMEFWAGLQQDFISGVTGTRPRKGKGEDES
jgi:polyhydroxyalkanoate synthesis repressor PhaR